MVTQAPVSLYGLLLMFVCLAAGAADASSLTAWDQGTTNVFSEHRAESAIESHLDWPDSKKADALFDWHESAFPEVFFPPTPSDHGAGWYFRYYWYTQTYLGTYAGTLYWFDPHTRLEELGPVETLLTRLMPRVQGLVYTFDEAMETGRVEVHRVTGERLADVVVEVNPMGSFAMTPVAPLPDDFIVTVGNLGSTHSLFPMPDELQVLIDRNQLEQTLVRVTPLSSLVARYAMRTGHSLVESDAAIASLVGLQPGLPSALVPLPEGGAAFCFWVFGREWIASGLAFDAFLDELVDDALAGRTRYFEGTADEFATDLFKWILTKVAEGAVKKVGETGMGQLMKLVIGPDPLEDIKDQLKEMTDNLNRIHNSIKALHGDMRELVKILETQNAYNTMRPAIIEILELHDKRLLALSTISIKADAIKEADAIDHIISERVMSGLALIHDMLADTSVVSAFYGLLAEQLLLQTESGQITLEGALNKYAHVFIFMTGVQLKGLVLVSEHYHRMTSEADIQERVMDAHARHIEKLVEQSARFLDGAEMLLVHAAPRSGFTMDYRGGDLMAGTDSPFFQLDALVADATNTPAQVTVRLLWDALAPVQYPWSDRSPQDYNRYFGFMQDRFTALETPGASGPVLLLRADSGASVEAVNKYGTINPMPRKRPTRTPADTRAVVRRYVFQNLEIGRPYTLTVSSETAQKFDLRNIELMELRGTIGRKLVSSDPAIRTQIGTNMPYTTLPLFAWLPESYMLRGGQPDPIGGEALLTSTQEEPGEPRYAVKNDFCFGCSNYLRSERHNRELYRARGYYPKDLASRHALKRPREWAAVDSGDRRLRFGDSIILKVPRSDDDGDQTELGTSEYADRLMSYKRNVGDAGRLTIEPLPSVAGMFIDPRGTIGEPVFPRKDSKIFIRTRHGYMRIEDNGYYVRADGEVKPREQRWTFEGL